MKLKETEMIIDFREKCPTNTCKKKYKNYRTYKTPWLETDYYQRCGYCNGHDSWSGGRRGMQIDHFAPKKKFPKLETEYDNLVYSCFYCNNNKSDDWVTNDASRPICAKGLTGYIHPRNTTYDAAFKRSLNGKILPQNDVAKYMFTELCLGMKRHELIFKLEQLEKMWIEIHNTIGLGGLDEPTVERLTQRKMELADRFLQYFVKYKQDLNN
jgi:uncharacterized protein (TIGR02646 family)